MIGSEYNVSQVLSESFKEHEHLYIKVMISIEENNFKPNFSEVINLVLMNSESINVTGFQPSRKLCTCGCIMHRQLS